MSRKQLTKEQAIYKATEIVLSCRRCQHPTDHEFDDKTSTWNTVCECGKTTKYNGDFVAIEVDQIAREFYED